MLELSSLNNLNAFGTANVLTPIVVCLMGLGILTALVLVPLMKLHWAKILYKCYNHNSEN